MNKNLYSRLIGYTFKHKGLFFLSIVGFFLFAAADISAVEWLKQVIAYINESSTNSFNPLNLAAFLGFIAIILAAINIFGGFLVTQRMLQMYKKKKDKKK